MNEAIQETLSSHNDALEMLLECLVKLEARIKALETALRNQPSNDNL